MKSAQIDNFGEPSEIHVREVEKPKLGDDQVLIEASAASLNPFDVTVLSGRAQSMAPLNLPATLGLDVAGVVVTVGKNVSDLAAGDRVYGTANSMFTGSGAFAEYVSTNASSVGHTPDSIDDVAAASLPTAGISALQAINAMNIQPGQKIFINGGSGGVGSIAIQIAKARGAYVAATASAINSEFVVSLGADEIVDYNLQSFTDVLHNYDAALTTVRDGDLNSVLGVLKQGGVAISLIGSFDDAKMHELGVTGIQQITHVTTESLDELSALVDQDLVKPTIDKSFSLDKTQAAYESLVNDSIKGKVVLTIS